VLAPYETAHEVELVRRVGTDATYVFALNHSTEAVELQLSGTDLVTGAECTDTLSLAGGAVAVVEQRRGG